VAEQVGDARQPYADIGRPGPVERLPDTADLVELHVRIREPALRMLRDQAVERGMRERAGWERPERLVRWAVLRTLARSARRRVGGPGLLAAVEAVA
jgi:hypothetical protein